MNEEEKEAIKEVKEIIDGDYEYPSILNEIMKTNYGNKDLIELWYATDDENSNYEEYTDLDIAKAIVYLVNLADKQQKQIKILKDNLVEERAFCKSTLETLKNCVDKDYLHKMISFKDGEIEKLKEAYQILKDDIEGHRIAYVDTPEFEENYISKDKIRDIIFEFIPKSNHEVELRTKIIKLLGE